MGGFVTSSSKEQNEKASTAHCQLANTVKVILQESSGQAAILFKEESIETIIDTSPNDAVGGAVQTEAPIISEKARKVKARKDRKEKAMAEKKRKDDGEAAVVEEDEAMETTADAAATLGQKETEAAARDEAAVEAAKVEEAKVEAAAGETAAAEEAAVEGVTGIDAAAVNEAAGASHTEIDEEEGSGEDSSSDGEEVEEVKGSAEEVAKENKKTRKVDFNATPVKAAKGAGNNKGGADEGSGSVGD